MTLDPLLGAGIAGDFGVEDEKAGFQLFDMRPDALAMLFEQFAALRLRRDTTILQLRIAEHFPDRHPRRFQAAEKLDPGED
jgi:hypothetical protein